MRENKKDSTTFLLAGLKSMRNGKGNRKKMALKTLGAKHKYARISKYVETRKS